MTWANHFSSMMDANLNTFGVPVTYALQDGTTKTIRGIFSKAYVEINGVGGVPTAGLHSMLDVKLADLPAAPSKTDRITVNGSDYQIIESREDGEGGSTLILRHMP